MAVRSTPNQVRGIAPNIPKSVDLTPFIQKASLFVKRIVANLADSECSLDEEDLEAIECYLAAHMYYTDPGSQVLQSKKVGRSSETYAVSSNPNAKGFNATKFGEMAMLLDCTGTLQSTVTVQVAWLGTECPTESGW